ncbi:hypothetical protein [Burkholderia ubonensis]|uniref:hypothetical protein n=1 Tax=Burkholderia ubonensis TaxID=101571 RepID=UPI000751DD12|nr:hypothetical protein [Burkholderia ubonensis]KVP39634.1 hypothetical protein WJ87_05225 [Burkholderia ubonensis]
MAKSMTRALRRHHTARLKYNRRFHYGRDLAEAPRQLGKAVTTAAGCSCWMCGNPRKYFLELTMQERRLFQDIGDE